MVAMVSGGRMVETGGIFSSVDEELPPLPLVALSSYLGDEDDASEDDVTTRLGSAVVEAGAGWSREWKKRSTSLDLSKGPL